MSAHTRVSRTEVVLAWLVSVVDIVRDVGWMWRWIVLREGEIMKNVLGFVLVMVAGVLVLPIAVWFQLSAWSLHTLKKYLSTINK